MCRDAAGGESADQHREYIDHQVHAGPDSGARLLIVIDQQVLQLEIDEGADEGVEKDEQADKQQVATVEEFAEARECPATDVVEGTAIRAHCLVVQVAVLELLQPDDQGRGQGDQPGGHQQQRVRADVSHQQRCQGRPTDAADAGAGADKTEQAGGLGSGKGVRHKTPEYGDMEQAEQAYPDVKTFIQQHRVGEGLGAEIEQGETRCEQAVYRRYQPADIDAGHCRAVDRYRNGTEDEGESPQPADLGVGPVARHGVTHRAQDVVGAHQYQHEGERRQGRPHLVCLYVAGPGQDALQ